MRTTNSAQNNKRAWFNQPDKWEEQGETLSFTVPAATDYWRIAHYDFIRDSGPFRYEERSGDFEAVVLVFAEYEEQYHQAGLMIRIDERNWIKTGIEFVHGKQNVSAVVTRDFSDWSVIAREDNPECVWMRLQRQNDAVKIEYSLEGKDWKMLRLAYFPPLVPARIGMFAAAPGKQRFEVRFDRFYV